MSYLVTLTHPKDAYGATRTLIAYYDQDWRPHDEIGATYYTEAREAPDGQLVFTCEGLAPRTPDDGDDDPEPIS